MKTSAQLAPLWAAMTEAAAAVNEASDFRAANANHVGGIMSSAEISRGEDGVIFDIQRREAQLTNHEELKLRGLIGACETALSAVLRRLEAILPGHRLTYSVSAHDAKHRLGIDGLDVLDAVQSTWKGGQLKLIRDIYDTSGRGQAWLLDMHFRGQGFFDPKDVVFAPSLAEAAARWKFAETSLTDRRKKNLRDVKIFAAAAFAAGQDAGTATPCSIDPAETRRILETLAQEIGRADPSLPASISVEIGSAARETPSWQSHEISPLLHADDHATLSRSVSAVESALKTAVAALARLAPRSDFSLKAEVSLYAHRVTATVGTRPTMGGGELAHALETMENAAGQALRPFLIPSQYRNEVVVARSPAEALDRSNYQSLGSRPDPLPLSPVRHDEVLAASEEANAILSRTLGL